MAKISDSAIATVALNAGVPRDQLAKAVAIALAESGGDTTAHNPVPPDDSYGLWQINMLGSLGPARRQQFGLTSNEALYDPAVNARAMVAISSKGTNWGPWTTYTRGTYLIYLSRGKTAADSAGGDTPTVPIITPTVPSILTFTKFVKLVTDRAMWIRFGLFIIGLGLTSIALVKMTGDNRLSPNTKKLIKTAASFVPGAGKVVTKATTMGKVSS